MYGATSARRQPLAHFKSWTIVRETYETNRSLQQYLRHKVRSHGSQTSSILITCAPEARAKMSNRIRQVDDWKQLLFRVRYMVQFWHLSDTLRNQSIFTSKQLFRTVTSPICRCPQSLDNEFALVNQRKRMKYTILHSVIAKQLLL